MAHANYSPSENRQVGTHNGQSTEVVVAEVARMMSEWEDSGELTTTFARRVVAVVRQAGRGTHQATETPKNQDVGRV